jgi:hypothetical protein
LLAHVDPREIYLEFKRSNSRNPEFSDEDFSMDEIIIFDEYAYVDHSMYETVINPSVPTGSAVKNQRVQLQ